MSQNETSTTSMTDKSPERCLVGFRNKSELTPDKSFLIFFFKWFATAVRRVEGKFRPGKHLIEWCSAIQANPKTLLVSARKHLKTTVALGYVAWMMWKALYHEKRPYDEWLFMAYKEDLAEYQLKRLNRYIEALPELFGDAQKLTDAETILRYGYQGREFICEPAGILAFKRGRAPRGLICDDILKDPQNPKMSIGMLEMIERIFLEEVESLSKEELHIFGTPQDESDIFSKIEAKQEYWHGRYDAMQNEAKRIALWPEEWPFERLEAKRLSIGEKAFNKEYRCRPVRSEDCFLKPGDLDAIIYGRLKNYSCEKPPILREMTFAGFDIGKKSHPSHLCILAESRRGFRKDSGNFENRLVQVHSKWMDGWSYNDQLDYLQFAINKFKVAKLFYDNTRGEFEAYQERGELPPEMEPFIFSRSSKGEIATKLDEKITNKTLWLVNDQRQRRQLLSVDNDYQAVQTAEGHGDCFFSLALAIKSWMDGKGILLSWV